MAALAGVGRADEERIVVTTKRKKQAMISEIEKAELELTPEKKETLEAYRKRHDRRVRELEYESNNGFYPPKPWYEE